MFLNDFHEFERIINFQFLRFFWCSGNESDYSGNESDNDDDDRDKIVRAALISGPNLRIIHEIPCNETDIPQEPYPILGTFEYTDTQILNAAV